MSVSRVLNWLGNLMLVALGILILAPFLWLFITSVVPEDRAFALPPDWIPTKLDWTNYRQVFELIPFGGQVMNSVQVTAIVVVGSLLVSSMAAYAFARLRFPGRELLFVVFLAAMMIPIQVLTIPTYIMMRYARLLDTEAALWLPGLIQVFSIFLLRQHFRSIPREVEEAARIDGAGHLRTLFQIFLPMSAPVLSALAIFIAQTYWNDFFAPSVYLISDSRMTIPVGLVSLQNQFGSNPTVVIFAGVTLVVLPLLALFAAVQSKLTQGVALTGISR
ncbi:carbohydrate ABC transporter permease [Fodinicola acaciae]|uniref:carbohydrate ABC transporter permease n=1 Tax=Fodinicola acaciae TaxID=2681555 RepID=UPI0013D4A177|nr:carbohydrate ABC transporter permease [Fodinicola acaciae]